MRTLVAVATLAALIAACGERPGPAAGPDADSVRAPAAADWRAVISPEDSAVLGRLDQAWRLARAEAESEGFDRQVEALGPLVDPNAGLGDLEPPPGSWRCRSIRLGTSGAGGPAYVEAPFSDCAIENSTTSGLVLTRIDGSRRTSGRLYPDTDRRMIYIGAEVPVPGEPGAPVDGEPGLRDGVGMFERVGSDRWRLVQPWPGTGAKLEILELIPDHS
jgi:predicted small lipoprotein YifL